MIMDGKIKGMYMQGSTHGLRPFFCILNTAFVSFTTPQNIVQFFGLSLLGSTQYLYRLSHLRHRSGW
jgi:hypothetical protein